MILTISNQHYIQEFVKTPLQYANTNEKTPKYRSSTFLLYFISFKYTISPAMHPQTGQNKLSFFNLSMKAFSKLLILKSQHILQRYSLPSIP